MSSIRGNSAGDPHEGAIRDTPSPRGRGGDPMGYRMRYQFRRNNDRGPNCLSPIDGGLMSDEPTCIARAKLFEKVLTLLSCPAESQAVTTYSYPHKFVNAINFLEHHLVI